MKKLFHVILIITVFAYFAEAQTLKAWLSAGDNAFEQKDFFSALKYYQIALEVEEDNAEIIYKYAESARLFNAFTIADSAYLQVLEKDTSGNNFPLLIFHMAEVKKTLGKYAEAIDLFKRFSKSYSADDEFLQKSKKAIVDCSWALKQIQQSEIGFEIERFDNENVNTPASEFNSVEIDGDLYFSSFNFTTKETDTGFEMPVTKILKLGKDEEVGEPLYFGNDKTFAAHTAFSKDKSKIYYTLCEYSGYTDINCEIYYRKRKSDDTWSEAVKLPNHINLKGYTTTDPSIGYDEVKEEEVLFFSSDRPDGKGKKDIWISFISKEGTFSIPENLKEINTSEDDISPFYHQPTHTLFFSTKGLKTRGGFDIYKSERKNNTWATPLPMDSPLNSSFNDVYFSLNDSQTKGYFSSNRIGSTYIEKEKEACCNDIYIYKPTIFNYNIFTLDARSGNPLLGSTVKLYQLNETGKRKINEKENESGNDFSFELKKGKVYEVEALRSGYIPEIEKIDLTNTEHLGSKTIDKNIYLRPAEIELLALVFDFETKEALSKATVQLFLGKDQIDLKENINGNDFHFALEGDTKYTVIAFKAGYYSDTTYIDLAKLGNPMQVEKKLFLKLKTLSEFPPLVLYFDNDVPDRVSRKSTTSKSYEDTYLPYYVRKEEYKREYTSVLEGRDKFLAEQRMEAFFEREIKNGYESLKVFSERLLFLLQKGQRIEVQIKGYASPRGSKWYNFKLGKRRVNCLRNNFDTFANGALLPFLANGQLAIVEKSFGEETAPKVVSDRLKDERNSIYSILASLERRTEIIGVRIDY